VNASHHTDPPPEFRPLLGAAFPCTNEFSSLPGKPSNADSLTDKDRPVRTLEKLEAASASDDISGARPGYIYLENLGPGTHVVQITGR
jgi:hypothetical protein